MDNKTKEDKAIKLVTQYEMKRRKLKTAATIKRAPRNSGFDLISGDRNIEVKATSQNYFNEGLRLNSTDEINFIKGGGYIYRVINVLSKKPQLYIVKGNEKNIGKVQESASYRVPKDQQGEPIDL